MNINKLALQRTFTALLRLTALSCAALMLCVVPLYFDNAFFNINRCKVNLICMTMPWICAAAAVFSIGTHAFNGTNRMEKLFPSDIAMLLFLIACTVSCAMQGFSESVLNGTSGRNLGLWLMLCLGGAYYVIAFGQIDGRLLTGAMLICATLCAGLGVLNGAGIDPLGFYQGIKKGQETIFFSTIGNFDFFGTYLVMLFGVSSGILLFTNRAIWLALAWGCTIILALGMIVSRTDCAFAGMFLVCLTLSVLSGGEFTRMSRAALLWSVCFALIPTGRAILNLSPY